ncbi:MAG TPA: hypothetical protein VE575_02190 [Acidimicrobiales bacterium]|nr:hypothetical protein [Acidimicrobiales bacterium]
MNTPSTWESPAGARDVPTGHASTGAAAPGSAGTGEPPWVRYERQAEAEEHSPMPFILKITRLVTWIVYAVVLAKAALLATAFFFRLAGANPDASFASWVYRSADRSMDPFRGIFPTRELTSASVLDLSLLFAAAVYLVLALVIDAGLRWLGRQLSDRERRVAHLRAAARDAAAREYAMVEERTSRQVAAAQAAAVAAVATAPRTDAGTPAVPGWPAPDPPPPAPRPE